MKKYIKEQVYQQIIDNNRLSFEISEALGIQQQSVLQSARRRSHRVFRDVLIIDILKEYGLKENEIFEQVKK